MAQLFFDISQIQADVIKDQNPQAASIGLNGNVKGIWTGTQAQYDAYESHDENIIYFIIGDAEEA